MANAVLDGKKQRDEMRRRTVPPCATCRHWQVGTETCPAFPLGIPDDIFIYGNNHRNPHPGDNGIRYEPVEK